MQRSLCPKAVPQILKSDKLTFQEKEYLTMALMKEQIRANGKTVQDCIKEKSSSIQAVMCLKTAKETSYI